MKNLVSVFFLSACVATAADPFLMFHAVAPDVSPALQKHFRSTDYLSVKTAGLSRELDQLVPPEHRFIFEPGLQRIENAAAVCRSMPAVTIFYAWGAEPTPAAELARPVESMRRAVAALRKAGCSRVGLAPDPAFFGFASRGCAYNLDRGLFREIDWTAVDFLDLQGEVLLSERCASPNSLPAYVDFAQSVGRYVRERNPRIVIAAQLSFRFTAPAAMVQALRQLSGVVDGFLLAYPLSPAREHKYSTPDHLTAVLQAVRPVPDAR